MAEQVFGTFEAWQAYEDYALVDGESVFGSETDLADGWGLEELTVEQLKSDAFSVVFDVAAGGALTGNTALVNDVSVEVFFTLPYGNYNRDGLPPKVPSPFAAAAIGTTSAGGTRVVVVGLGGLIRYSDDFGETWTDADSGTASTLWGVAPTADGFVAVGEMGTVVSSSDGESWEPQVSLTTDHLFSVVGTKRALITVAVGKNESKRRRFDTNESWEIR